MAFEGFGYMKGGLRKKRYVAFREPLVSMDTAGRVSTEVYEESPPTGQHSLQPDPVSEMALLSNETKSEEFVRIDMPSNTCPTPKKVNLLGSTSEVYVGSSSNSNGSTRGLPPKPKSKFQSGTLDMEEVAILALGGLQPPPSERYPFLGVPINRATSMPANSIQPSNPNATDDCYIAINSNGVGEQQPIYRSRSVPVNYTNGTARENRVPVFRVVPNRRMTERNSALSRASTVHNDEEDEDDITEEEAVCRICFEELGEELETFKLECDCRGDLALVHMQCSQRWFNIRGNRTCEICRKEVKNITVKVRRMPTIDLSSLRHLQQPPMVDADRLWQEFPILVVVSIAGYFLSVKLLHNSNGGSEDIGGPYGIPSSCMLGLITALGATAFALRKHVWIYALSQYLGFTVFSQIFDKLLHLEPVPTLVLAMVLSMGFSRGAGPLYHAIKKWRAARRNQLNDNSEDGAAPTELEPTQEYAERHHTDADRHESNE
uniref:RING-CH-type domain-containing protein n=1 Tax=Kalanchoe fedtschenkoi TaxID=63787 RepID=A0A7N1A6M0_KALFE